MEVRGELIFTTENRVKSILPIFQLITKISFAAWDGIKINVVFVFVSGSVSEIRQPP